MGLAVATDHPADSRAAHTRATGGRRRKGVGRSMGLEGGIRRRAEDWEGRVVRRGARSCRHPEASGAGQATYIWTIRIIPLGAGMNPALLIGESAGRLSAVRTPRGSSA
ncbi:hypothetical protein Pmi06nite_57940 [Planotetraspora mira]|uniref:Uncharacterized protein n=1 Tax=Planotetraspora mira TaxID=58121 RepID=A0A8J3TVZ7_9ACTN|nr:hypothetical protein Pmi06nite_57940 [Planotetraspora mira]